jgi:CHAD domain-containing protein
VKASREVETKLDLPDGFAVPHLLDVEGVARLAVRSFRLRATYYDTEDLRLARSGTTLRHRTGEGRPRWTLKLATVAASGLDREELTVDGSGTSVPPALQDLLTARLRGAALQKAVQLRTRRTSSLLFDADGTEVAEVVDDQVEVVRGTVVEASWRELEVEERDGGALVVAGVLSTLREAGAAVGAQTPKAVRALGPQGVEPADLPVRPKVRAKDPVGLLVRWALTDGLLRLVEHDVGVRRGQDDAVHQVRVSCRRLRSDLRTFRPLLDDPRAEQLRAELAWLADSFGAARDLEVLRERVRATAGEDPLAPLDATGIDAVLAQQEEEAVRAAVAALRSPRYLVLLQLLHDVALAPGLTELAERRCDEVLPGLVDKAWAHLLKRARRLHLKDPDADWHRARILAKRARYAAESAQVALGKDVKPIAKAAKRVQEQLGEHQDAAVTAARVLSLTDEHPADHLLAVTCGRLAERERADVVRARRRFLKARDTLT